MQGWKPRRIYADFIVTLRGDDAGEDDGFHEVFVVETKGVHLKASEDTEYKRSVFDICSEHARKADWAKFVPDAQQGDPLRGRGRGRVAGALESNAVPGGSLKQPVYVYALAPAVSGSTRQHRRASRPRSAAFRSSTSSPDPSPPTA